MHLSRLVLMLALLSPLYAQADDRLVSLATLTVQGEATTKVNPDEATLPVTVREQNSELKVARDHHDNKLRALLKLAADSGIPKDKIRTQFTSVNPIYTYNSMDSRQHLNGYEASTTVEFKFTDLSKVGVFMNAVTDLGIDTIGSISYGLQDESQVKEDTLMKAMENAAAKAHRLASTAKVSLDKIITVTEGNVQMNMPQPRPMMMAMASNASPRMAPPELPSGLIEVQQTVTVSYAIK